MSSNGKLGFFVACAALSAIIVFAYAAPRATAIGAVWKSCCAAGYPTCDYGPSCVLVSGWYCCSTGWSLVPCPDICTGCAKHTQSCSLPSLPCCGAYSVDSTCYYSGKCAGTPSTCTFSTCSLSDQCSGINRCGSASGDIRNYSGSCGSGGCAFVTEECGCGALDSDGGQVSTTKGTCTDYTGCSGAACTHVNYTDSCIDGDTVREYYVTGTGDAATCGYVDRDCSVDYFCYAGRCVPDGTPTTSTTLPGACNLVSASVTANCAGGASADCEAGETITMSGTYTGTCAASLFQIDAKSADATCDIQYNGGDMSGVWDSSITLTGGAVANAVWTIPPVAADCAYKTVSAYAAALWNGLPGSGMWIDGAETVSGSFKFAGAVPTTTTTTTLPGESFTLAIKPGWNLISVPYRTIYGAELDGCGMANGNFYFYDAATGKWNVKTVGITSLRKATSYWFYSTGYCSVIVRGYDDVAASDVVLVKNEWSDVGAPKDGMTLQSLTDAACPTCSGNRCNSMKVLYYDTLAGQFKVATSLQEGVGYRVQCVGS